VHSTLKQEIERPRVKSDSVAEFHIRLRVLSLESLVAERGRVDLEASIIPRSVEQFDDGVNGLFVATDEVTIVADDEGNPAAETAVGAFGPSCSCASSATTVSPGDCSGWPWRWRGVVAPPSRKRLPRVA
jgi:hypothetical protein